MLRGLTVNYSDTNNFSYINPQSTLLLLCGLFLTKKHPQNKILLKPN